MEKIKQIHLIKSARLERGVLNRSFWVSLFEKMTFHHRREVVEGMSYVSF